MISFKMEGAFIKLDQLLKAANVVDSGGQAKIFIHAGMIKVNGEVATQRGKKIFPDDEVVIDQTVIKVTC